MDPNFEVIVDSWFCLEVHVCFPLFIYIMYHYSIDNHFIKSKKNIFFHVHNLSLPPSLPLSFSLSPSLSLSLSLSLVGYICETVIDAQEGLIKKKLYCVEVYQLMYDMTGSPEPVTGT